MLARRRREFFLSFDVEICQNFPLNPKIFWRKCCEKFLTSCSSIKPLEVFNLEVKREPLNLDQPEIADFEDLDWYIITSDNAEEMFAKLKEKNLDPVLFGLTDDGYEALSKNFAQIRHYIQKQKLQLDTYKNYYEPGVKSKIENKTSTK